MFDNTMLASKEFIEFQRGVFTGMLMFDGIKNALLSKGILTKDELAESMKAVLESDYAKGRMTEYDKAIKEIEEYEKMDIGDLFSSMFDPKAKKKEKEDQDDQANN